MQNKLKLLVSVFFLIVSSVTGFTQKLELDELGMQKERIRIIREATDAYRQQNYRLVHELGRKYFSIENEDENIDKNDLKYFFFIVGESSILVEDNKFALLLLGKAIDLGYGTGREYAILLVDPKFKQIRPKSTWKGLLKRSCKNFRDLAVSNGDNPEATLLYQTDQVERAVLVPELIRQNRLSENDVKDGIKRDTARRKKMRKLLSSGRLKSANDFYAAAMVFHHSANIKDTKLANSLAKKSLLFSRNKAEKCRAGWLYAASLDRYLWLEGKPQIYGTQKRPIGLSIKDAIESTGNGKSLAGIKKFITILSSKPVITLDPININGVTNQERLALCVPPIESPVQEIQ
ncbi:MAG: hypothetical protein ACK5NT_01455 [Pyrinomonadaceae bacterium]